MKECKEDDPDEDGTIKSLSQVKIGQSSESQLSCSINMWRGRVVSCPSIASVLNRASSLLNL